MNYDPSGAETAVQPGDILAGKYRVDKVIGAGGMGVVVAAHHIQLDERVALKFLLPHALTNPEAVARFAREARAAVKIKSEHVARVSDVGTLESGAPYIVMEYLEGEDLGAWVQKRGPLAVDQAVEFILQACEAVADAHALGIIHRDLKPANLFCIRRSDGTLSVKVLDFGISKVTSMHGSGPDMGMTKTTAIMGSPLYMSPEQMQSSRNVDPRSDIWAIGIILHELLTGNVPFQADTIPELCMRILTMPPDSVRAVRADVPEELELVIARCLEKDRNRRFPNVADLAIALAPFAPKRARGSVERVSKILQNAGMSDSSPEVEASLYPQAGTPARTAASWGQTGPGESRSRMGLVIGAAIALVMFGSAATFFLVRQKPAPAAAVGLVAPAASVPTPTTAAPAPSAEPSPSTSATAAPTMTPAQAAVPRPAGPKPVGKPAAPPGQKKTAPAAAHDDMGGRL